MPLDINTNTLLRGRLVRFERDELEPNRPPRAEQHHDRVADTFERVGGTRVDRPAGPPPGNDDILFLGFNPTGKREAENLERGSGNKVVFIGDLKNDGVAGADGRTYDLKDRASTDAFTRTLGLPEAQRARIADVIARVQVTARDEMAQLAQQWAVAEKGGTIPSRMVLSSHHDGTTLWGDGNGGFSRDDLRELTRAMPRAAGQVEDLNVAACYSGGKIGLDAWRQMFPNAKTILAYRGSSPGADSGSNVHLARWERATRGRGDALDPSIVRGTRKAENVDTWSASGGYVTPGARELPELQRRYEQTKQAAAPYLSGDREVADPQSGPLREHYNNIQALVQNPAVAGDELRRLGDEIDVVLRAMFYRSHVAPAFQRSYGPELQRGYAALGLTAPDFGRLSRKDALAAVSAFETRAQGASMTPELEKTLRLLGALRDLNPHYLRVEWI